MTRAGEKETKQNRYRKYQTPEGESGMRGVLEEVVLAVGKGCKWEARLRCLLPNRP